MTDGVFTLAPSATAPGGEAWFALPAGFTALPLDALLAAPGTAGAGELLEAVDAVVGAAPSEGGARERVVGGIAAAQQMFLALRQEGVVHCSLGLHRDDQSDGPVLVSLFTFAWRQIAWAPREVTAARAVTGGGQAGVEVLELPCGPASAGETLRAVPAGLGVPQKQLLQINAYLPHPDGRRLAVLTLSTGAAVRRSHYRALLRDIAEHTSFDDPLPPE